MNGIEIIGFQLCTTIHLVSSLPFLVFSQRVSEYKVGVVFVTSPNSPCRDGIPENPGGAGGLGGVLGGRGRGDYPAAQP